MNEREEEKPDKNGDSGDSEDDSHLPLELLAMQASHDDDDDDDDNWSRQVETDETGVAGGDESVSMREAMESLTVSEQQQQLQQEQQTGHLNNANSESRHEGREHIVTQASASASNSGIIPLGPVQPELTMKEKLVLRERQRRIETQRARLKRQFALSNAQEGEDYLAAQNLLDSSGQLQLSEAAVRVVRDNGSAAGTLGEESTVAHPDEDGVVGQDNAQEEKLGFNMERFLRNGDSFNPELESTAEDKATGVPNSSTAPADKGPVMERFLNEPVVVGDNTSSEMDAPKSSEPPTNASTEVQRSVSFEVNMMDVAATDENSELGGDDIPGVRSLPSFNETTPSMDANVSVLVHADEDDVARDPLIMSMTSMDAQESVVSVEDGVMMPNTGSASTSSSRNEEPRFLRLTEADMQEMAAIEEASIGNGPPSDRSEEGLSESEIGELADFRGGHHNHHNHVHDAAGNLSQDTPTTAMDSASMLSGGNQSAQPTSATSDHDHDHIGDQHSLDGMPSVSVSSQLLVSPGEASANNNPMSDTARDEEDHRQERGRTSELTHQPILEDDDHSDSSSSEVLVNRRLRPGMGNHLRPQNARSASTGPSTTAVQAPTSPLVVEGFDFDKDEPMSPHTDDHDDSLRDLPDDGWSPGTGKMSTSPIRIRSSAAKLSPTEEEEFAAQSRTYGSIVGEEQGRGGAPNFPSMKAASNNRNNESQPLLGDVPPEITTRRQASEGVSGSEVYPSSLRSVLHGHGKGSDVDEAALYNSSSVLKKAFPDRMLVLCATLLVEMPVLLMITARSEALCGLIGRRRFYLLFGMIILNNAISGNVGLQASNLTTRAISQSHVKVGSYMRWFMSEVGAAAYLGLGMGCLLGGIALFASEMDFSFAFTIMIAQFSSIVTAGISGTFAPLLFSFVFKGDRGKWGGPLETALQDIVGTFAMVVVSYYLLAWFGAGNIDPIDSCGIVS